MDENIMMEERLEPEIKRNKLKIFDGFFVGIYHNRRRGDGHYRKPCGIGCKYE